MGCPCGQPDQSSFLDILGCDGTLDYYNHLNLARLELAVEQASKFAPEVVTEFGPTGSTSMTLPHFRLWVELYQRDTDKACDNLKS